MLVKSDVIFLTSVSCYFSKALFLQFLLRNNPLSNSHKDIFQISRFRAEGQYLYIVLYQCAQDFPFLVWLADVGDLKQVISKLHFRYAVEISQYLRSTLDCRGGLYRYATLMGCRGRKRTDIEIQIVMH